ncbi:CIA30 family protein [Chitinispirillales bacterium ANBcel5]|uniref:hypothetical protein n=1 Tax=Cellulosispirillum alkaliphilum TaxID=3039283 RepID=UPI002A53F23B|nr:CIA30 family protein [Chitinispirillales bacterium ANBcel5]
MGRFFKKSLVTGLATVLAASSSLFAENNAVFDDLEHGSNQNLFGDYWYFYDDQGDNNPGTSEVENATRDGDELLFEGGYGPGKDSDYAARLEFAMGSAWEDPQCAGMATCWEISPFVGMGSNLVPDGAVYDLTGATAISFYHRGSSEIPVAFRLELATVLDAAHYQYMFTTATTDWERLTVEITGGEEGSGMLAQPEEWGDEADYDLSQASKISWQFQGEEPTDGWFAIDSIVIHNHEFIPPDMCTDCVGEPDPPANEPFSDFEESGTQNATGFYWYEYDDGEAGGSSDIFLGVDPDADEDMPTLILEGNGREGNGAMIGFELGSAFTSGGETVQPFVGIGTNLTDEGLENPFIYNADANDATALYFEYRTDGLDKITVEVSDHLAFTGSRGEGVVYYIDLPGTDNEWRSATIPWSTFVLPTWDSVLDDSPLQTDRLAQIQFKHQGRAGTVGEMALDNVYFVGATGYDPQPLIGNSVLNSRAHSVATGITGAYNRGTVTVNWNPSTEIQDGRFTLINTRGAVVSSAPVTRTSGNQISSTLNAASIPAGLYFIQVRARDIQGKSVNHQIPVNIVK